MHFKNITDLFEYMDAASLENPLIGLIQFDSSSDILKNKELSHLLYQGYNTHERFY